VPRPHYIKQLCGWAVIYPVPHSPQCSVVGLSPAWTPAVRSSQDIPAAAGSVKGDGSLIHGGCAKGLFSAHTLTKDSGGTPRLPYGAVTLPVILWKMADACMGCQMPRPLPWTTQKTVVAWMG